MPWQEPILQFIYGIRFMDRCYLLGSRKTTLAIQHGCTLIRRKQAWLFNTCGLWRIRAIVGNRLLSALNAPRYSMSISYILDVNKQAIRTFSLWWMDNMHCELMQLQEYAQEIGYLDLSLANWMKPVQKWCLKPLNDLVQQRCIRVLEAYNTFHYGHV